MTILDRARNTLRRLADTPAPRPVTDRELSISNIEALYSGHAFPMYNPDALITRRGLEIIDKMRQDDQIKAVMSFLKYAVLSPGWEITSSADDPTDEETRAVDFVTWSLDHMSGAVEEDFLELLTAWDYGFSVTEEVWEIVKDGPFAGLVTIGRLKTRKPHSFQFEVDAHGNLKPNGIIQNAGGRLIPLPSDKFILYTHQGEWDNPYGKSMLSGVGTYRAWWSKDVIIRCWNIALERFGNPLVIGKYKTSLTRQQQRDLETAFKNLAPRASMLTPDDVETSILEASMRGTVAYKQAVDEHNTAIARSLLMPTQMGLTPSPGVGTYAQSRVQFGNMLLLVLEALAEVFQEAVINEQLVRRLVEFNFNVEHPPYFRFLPMTEESRQEIMDIWVKAVQVGAAIPSVPDENWLREKLGVPLREVEPEPEVELGYAAHTPQGHETPRRRPRIYRALTPIEKKVDFAEIEKEMDFLLTRTEAALAPLLVKQRDQLKADVQRKSAGGLDPREIDKLTLKQVDLMRREFKRAFIDSHHAGLRSVAKEIRGHARAHQVAPVPLPPKEAMKYLEGKAFYVNGVLNQGTLARVQALLYQALKKGSGLQEIMHELDLLFEKLIPGMDIINVAQKTPPRLETIIRTNLTDSYNAGRKEMMRDPEVADAVIGVLYSAVLDDATTDVCDSLDGMIFRLNDPSLDALTPPRHFNCRSVLVPAMVDEGPVDYITERQINRGEELSGEGF